MSLNSHSAPIVISDDDDRSPARKFIKKTSSTHGSPFSFMGSLAASNPIIPTLPDDEAQLPPRSSHLSNGTRTSITKSSTARDSAGRSHLSNGARLSTSKSSTAEDSPRPSNVSKGSRPNTDKSSAGKQSAWPSTSLNGASSSDSKFFTEDSPRPSTSSKGTRPSTSKSSAVGGNTSRFNGQIDATGTNSHADATGVDSQTGTPRQGQKRHRPDGVYREAIGDLRAKKRLKGSNSTLDLHADRPSKESPTDSSDSALSIETQAFKAGISPSLQAPINANHKTTAHLVSRVRGKSNGLPKSALLGPTSRFSNSSSSSPKPTSNRSSLPSSGTSKRQMEGPSSKHATERKPVDHNNAAMSHKDKHADPSLALLSKEKHTTPLLPPFGGTAGLASSSDLTSRLDRPQSAIKAALVSAAGASSPVGNGISESSTPKQQDRVRNGFAAAKNSNSPIAKPANKSLPDHRSQNGSLMSSDSQPSPLHHQIRDLQSQKSKAYTGPNGPENAEVDRILKSVSSIQDRNQSRRKETSSSSVGNNRITYKGTTHDTGKSRRNDSEASTLAGAKDEALSTNIARPTKDHSARHIAHIDKIGNAANVADSPLLLDTNGRKGAHSVISFGPAPATLSPHSTSTQGEAGARESSMEPARSLQLRTEAVQMRTPESSRAVTPKKALTDVTNNNNSTKSPSARAPIVEMPPPDLPNSTSSRPIANKSDVEEVLNRCFNTLAEEQKYTVKNALTKARSLRTALENSDFLAKQPRRIFDEEILDRCYVNGMIGAKTVSPFASMKPMHKAANGKPDSTFNCITVETLEPGAKRIKGPSYVLGCQPTRWTDTAKTTPAYTQCTAVKKNVAAPNQKVLHSYPYFGENVDDKVYEALHSRYDVDARQRERKVADGQRSRRLMTHTHQWLEQIGCSEGNVLFYLLNRNISADQKNVYTDRERSCKHDFNREADHWTSVFKKVSDPAPSPEKVQLAAWACTVFLAKTKLSLWQIVRKSHIASPDEDETSKDGTSILDKTQQLACRICHEHDCPYHIDFMENSDFEDDTASLASVEALDLDWPPEYNFKRHVTIAQPLSERPDSRDEIVVAGRPASRDKNAYKRLLEQVIETSNHDRNRYYPCYHPGKSCADEECKCYRDGVLCEKACGCSSTCERKFQGCSCASGNRKTCYQDDRCDCFRLHRECDADLCKDCGADIVLDPENRHDDSIRPRHCQNVNMQLGIPKRTILGRSRIHGFGVYAGERIKRHDFVGEYSGEIVLEDERNRRGEVYDIQKMSYLFILTSDQEIDSHHVGNKMRFVNHASTTGKNGACNLRPEIVICNMTPRIGMYATRDIETGEELFFNYGDHYMQLLRDANAATADDRDAATASGRGGKEKAGKRGRKKKVAQMRRKKNTDLTIGFAEPEYEDLEVEVAGEGVRSKKVTPRWKGKGKAGVPAGEWEPHGERPLRVREMASKSAAGSRLGSSAEDEEGNEEEVAESEDEVVGGDTEVGDDEADESPIKVGRRGTKKRLTEEVEESDFEMGEDEDDDLPRRRSSVRSGKRTTYALDDEDEDEDERPRKKYVAPIINGKKKRGRPKKSMLED